MIEICKPAPPPVFDTAAAKRTAELVALYRKKPEDYREGKATFRFDRSCYGHDDVKSALVAAQHGKCCFCEAFIHHVEYGDVEHFRPKAAYRQEPNGPLIRPGYFWLAYDWDNLLLSCTLCNRRHKANYFPLLDRTDRAPVLGSTANEKPLLIDPTRDNPEKYIAFDGELPYAIDGDTRGKETIAALGLDRGPLNDHRRRFLALLEAAFTLARHHQGIADPSQEELAELKNARTLLQEAQSVAGEYSLMVKHALRDWNRRYGTQIP